MDPADPCRILVVCTGNICRSPMISALLADRLRGRLGADVATERFIVASTGTHALVGDPIEPNAAHVLAELGVHPAPFIARQLGVADVESADLVLGATREHRAAAVRLVPRAAAHAFTLRELARLAAAVAPDAAASFAEPAQRARQRVAEAGRRRGYVAAEHPGDDDVADPYGRSLAVFRSTGEQIRSAVDVVVGLIAPEPV